MTQNTETTTEATAETTAAPAITPGIYRHYKGNDYQVMGVVRHSETEEYLVLYKTLYGDYSSWVRPYSMFTDEVDVTASASLVSACWKRLKHNSLCCA